MKKILICAALALTTNAFSAIYTNRLDPKHIVGLNDNVGHLVINYDVRGFKLTSNTIYLDSEIPDDKAALSPHIYNNVHDAFAAINAQGDDVTLLVAPGVYWVDDPDDPEDRRPTAEGGPYAKIVNCKKLTLIGLTESPENVVFACNRGQTQGSVGNFTMFRFNCNEVEASNITFGNYCNVDLEFPLKEEYNREKRNKAIVQAQLVHTNADKVFVKNCRFISRLNMNPFVGGRRSLFEDCYMECTDDALAGSAVYLHCRFTFFSSKPFYSSANYGAVFLDCDIDTHVTSTQYFCKATGGITAIDTRFHTRQSSTVNIDFNYGPKNDSWYYSNVSVNEDTLQFSNAVDITDKHILNAYKVKIGERTVYNIANLMAGDDEWDPLSQRSFIPEEYIGIPTHAQLVRSECNKNLNPKNHSVDYIIELYRWGGYKANDEQTKKVAFGNVSWDCPNVANIVSNDLLSAKLTTNHQEAVRFKGDVYANLPSGLQAKDVIIINPYLYDAPSFASTPTISFDGKQKSLVLKYKLSADASGKTEAKDCSEVTWYRYTKEDKSDTIPVYYGTADVDGKTYPLSPADKKARILAKVTPRYFDTKSGKTETIVYAKAVGKTTESNRYSTDFHNIPVGYHPHRHRGTWRFDAYKPADTKAYPWEADPRNAWYYGEGEDGMKGKGLVQKTKGARCSFVPTREISGNMRAVVKIDPGKTGGQGFGSATGQYLDICIKFDTETLTGYALRIERTPDYSNAVTFKLVKYDNGKTEDIGASVVSNCFVSTCTVTIELRGEELIATAVNSGPLRKLADEEIQPKVSLKQKVTPNTFSGFCMQHTGSTGPSAAMIHNVELSWE